MLVLVLGGGGDVAVVEVVVGRTYFSSPTPSTAAQTTQPLLLELLTGAHLVFV